MHGISSYLDVIDPQIGKPIEELAEHIRNRMGQCTQLIAVVSRTTAISQWVPWEIGVATEKEFPLATYAVDGAIPPEFLRKWPYLRSDEDLDTYVRVSRNTQRTYTAARATLTEATARSRATKSFFAELRRELHQS